MESYKVVEMAELIISMSNKEILLGSELVVAGQLTLWTIMTSTEWYIY